MWVLWTAAALLQERLSHAMTQAIEIFFMIGTNQSDALEGAPLRVDTSTRLIETGVVMVAVLLLQPLRAWIEYAIPNATTAGCAYLLFCDQRLLAAYG